jgi:hypothetical protein
MDSAGNVAVGEGALATDATDGFLYVPGTEGVPDGTPTAYTGRSPVVADLNNNQLYFYTNSAWQSPREKLQGNRTYYVRTDGSDSNTGLVDSSGGAFLTIQHAVDVAYGLDWSIYDVTIQVGTGTYVEDFITIKGPNPGSGEFTLVGDTDTPTNVELTITDGVSIEQSALVNFGGFAFVDEGGLQITRYSRLTMIGSCDFGDCTGDGHIRIDGGAFSTEEDYSISGDCDAHIVMEYGSLGDCTIVDSEITLTGTPNFAVAFVRLNGNSVLFFDNASFTGSATGARYHVQNGAVIRAGGNTLPGDSAGVGTFFDVDPYGLYLA